MIRRGSLIALAVAVSLLASARDAVAAPDSQEVGRGHAFVTGRVLSYAWLLDDDPVGDEHAGHRRVRGDESVPWRRSRYDAGGAHVFDHNLGSWGTNYDAALAVGMRSRSDRLGLIYGADFALSVPIGSFGRSFYDEMVGAGSRIFADTPYGDFFLGYQEGVESSMKTDVLGLVPGGSSSAWGKYLRCFLGYASGMPFHMYPGLYSENLFRSIGSFDRVGVFRETRRFLGVLPMRLSYISPKVGGFSLGISYSPSGYRDDLFRGDAHKLGVVRKVSGGASSASASGSASGSAAVTTAATTPGKPELALLAVQPTFDLGPVYKNILSGALRYDWKSEDATFGVSVTGEYAKSKRYTDIYVPGADDPFVEYNNLAALSTGAEIGFAGLRVALSYGYLGNSGRPKVMSRGNKVWEVPYGASLPSYYFASSLGYRYGDLYSSVVYFVSRVGHTIGASSGGAAHNDYRLGFDGKHILRDLAVGLDYSLYDRKNTRLGLFVSCHAFSLKQELGEFKFVEGSGGDDGDYARVDPDERKRSKHSGVVVLSGVKFDF
ncbi:hypothetical protein OC188_02515 [Anaplasma capra]|uniref:hypothetical protein n=1 Tax=Anaplasma capra TaxID=1562740 RepID=UPI0021D60FD8|nr:hypothetical protein [Anaplasma capra]MCU7611567.1 hypothetical protein [Anaplasma capra]